MNVTPVGKNSQWLCIDNHFMYVLSQWRLFVYNRTTGKQESKYHVTQGRGYGTAATCIAPPSQQWRAVAEFDNAFVFASARPFAMIYYKHSTRGAELELNHNVNDAHGRVLKFEHFVARLTSKDHNPEYADHFKGDYRIRHMGEKVNSRATTDPDARIAVTAAHIPAEYVSEGLRPAVHQADPNDFHTSFGWGADQGVPDMRFMENRLRFERMPVLMDKGKSVIARCGSYKDEPVLLKLGHASTPDEAKVTLALECPALCVALAPDELTVSVLLNNGTVQTWDVDV